MSVTTRRANKIIGLMQEGLINFKRKKEENRPSPPGVDAIGHPCCEVVSNEDNIRTTKLVPRRPRLPFAHRRIQPVSFVPTMSTRRSQDVKPLNLVTVTTLSTVGQTHSKWGVSYTNSSGVHEVLAVQGIN